MLRRHLGQCKKLLNGGGPIVPQTVVLGELQPGERLVRQKLPGALEFGGCFRIFSKGGKARFEQQVGGAGGRLQSYSFMEIPGGFFVQSPPPPTYSKILIFPRE